MRPPAVNRIAQQRPSRTWEWQWSRVLRELIWMLVRASTLLLEQLKCLPASLQCLVVATFLPMETACLIVHAGPGRSSYDASLAEVLHSLVVAGPGALGITAIALGEPSFSAQQRLIFCQASHW